MIKNNLFTAVALFFLYTIVTAVHLETDRTLWIPWTLEHTQQWEYIEQDDSTMSQFRRNEFFENIQTLIQRDSNWEIFCTLLQKKTDSAIIFPCLGFAILDKISNELIGAIRFNFSSTKGYVTLSYGLKESVRHQKLGHEVAALAIKLIHESIGLPFASFKTGIAKSVFMAEWQEQGKLAKPNFNALLQLFDENTISLKGLTAFVDLINQPSLAILLKHGMQAAEVECSKYYLHEEPNLYCFNILLIYPATTTYNQEYIDDLMSDILSRDNTLIQNTHDLLKTTFSIPQDWVYLNLNRDEKALLKLVQSKIITTTFLSSVKVKIKTTQVCEFPYCFVQ